MCRILTAMSLGLALAVGLGSPALADHPSWDPSVGYNPEALDAAVQKAKREAAREAAKETPKAFAPAAGKGGEKSAPTRDPWEPARAWQPYQHPHPVGN